MLLATDTLRPQATRSVVSVDAQIESGRNPQLELAKPQNGDGSQLGAELDALYRRHTDEYLDVLRRIKDLVGLPAGRDINGAVDT